MLCKVPPWNDLRFSDMPKWYLPEPERFELIVVGRAAGRDICVLRVRSKRDVRRALWKRRHDERVARRRRPL